MIKKPDKCAAFFFADAEKVFDNVNSEFMKLLVKKLNLGDNFGNAIGVIYSQQMATLIINNDTSKPISVEKGTRQGCPLSPLLFIMVIEILLKQVQIETKIRGLQYKKFTYMYQAFADDMFLVEQPEDS